MGEEEDEGGEGGVAETTTDETTYGKGWKGESWSPSCPESYTGNVAYPDCRGYATCINGIFVGAPVECAYGLSFDAALGLCDFEANVVCGGDEDEDEDYEDGDDVDHYEDYEDESSTEEGGGGETRCRRCYRSKTMARTGHRRQEERRRRPNRRPHRKDRPGRKRCSRRRGPRTRRRRRRRRTLCFSTTASRHSTVATRGGETRRCRGGGQRRRRRWRRSRSITTARRTGPRREG